MGTAIVLLIMIVAVLFALKSSLKHMKGQGGCCGGGDVNVKTEKKKLEGPKQGEYTLQVEGMTCDHCKAKVENTVNELEGVVCRVNLKKKKAVISYDRQVARETVIGKIREAGYRVTE